MDDQTLEESLIFLVRKAKDDGQALDAKALLSTVHARLFGTNDSEPLRVGRFTVLRRIGQGGMGVVYEAYDPELHRHIAIKILTQTFAGSAPGDWLLHEARAVAQLSHPNVVTVHEIGHDGDELFVAMEYVDGPNLRDWQRERRPWRAILAAYAAAGEGLAAAHAAGIVHGDFKPHNVLIGKDSRVRVVDFGLARAVDQANRPIHPGELSSYRALEDRGAVKGIAGTLRYMAPELHRGVAPTPASDQYAYCVSLWQALQGTTERQESDGTGEGLRTRANRQVAHRIQAIVQRGLHENPALRWPSMRALLDALARDPAARRRTTMGILTLAIAVAASFGLPYYQRTQRLAACNDVALDLDGAWNGARQDRLRTVMLGHDDATTQSAWHLVKLAIDRFSAEWTEQSRRLCANVALNDGLASPEAVEQKACLDLRKTELDSLVSALEVRHDERMFHAPSAVASLLPPSICENPRFARRELDAGQASNKAREVATLRADIARADALRKIGRIGDAQAILEAIHTHATQLDFAPLTAEVGVLNAMILLENSGDSAAAIVAAEQAAFVALAARHEQTFAQAATLCMFIRNLLGHRQESELWRHLTASQLSRMTGVGIEKAYFHNDLGVVLTDLGECKGSVYELEQSIAVKAELWGPLSLEAAISVDNLGAAHLRCGHFAQALQEHRRALQMTIEHVGPIHPYVARTHYNLGLVQEFQGDNVAAKRSHALALAAIVQSEGDSHPWSGVMYTGLCRAEVRLGNHSAALELCQQAQTRILRGFGATSTYSAEVLLARAELLLAEHSYAAALQVVQEAIDALRPSRASGDWLASAFFMGAKAIVATEPGNPKAVAWARQAAETYRLAGGDWNRYADVIDAWLATHERK